MQGKGIVKFFLVVMILVTLIQYLFILPTNRVEKDAERYALSISSSIEDDAEQNQAHTDAVRAYLDSMSSQTIFKIPLLKSYTYQELKSQQLAYGLDLKGGMSVVLQIDLRELIRTLAQNSKDQKFRTALENASKAQLNAQSDFVALFADAWQEVRGEDRLAPIFQRNESLRDEINYETTDAEVIRILRTKADETVELTFNLLKQRIDKLGVVQPNVNLDQERDLILVELPGIDNPQRAREFLQAAANLEFFETFRVSDPAVSNALTQANEKLRTIRGANTEQTIERVDTLYVTDSLGNVSNEIEKIDTIYAQNSLNGPLFDLMSPGQGAVIGVVSRSNIAELKRVLEMEEILNLFPSDLRFRFSQKPFESTLLDESDRPLEMFEVYAIKMPRSGEAPLSGDHVVDASAQPDPQSNQIAVSLNMDQTGAKIWARMTTEAANNGNREIAILLDDEVASAPRVNEPITGGSSSISGSFSLQEATDLSNILEIGKLPASTEIIQESVVGPTLGAANIKSSMTALAVGFLIVIAFMVFYYGGGGIVSVIALLLNLVFIFGALASYGTVLTLPGFAGIILTIGMAVDANVIIYERIREELREGKSTIMAVADGFKHSYSAIIDANVTTILTAIVLAYFGLGPIKGFAVVLIIGVLSSLFTAVLVGRLMLDSYLKRKKDISFNTSVSKNAFANMQIDWMGKRRIAYIISGTLIALSLVSFVTRGFELGVDFKGGYNYNISFDDNIDVDIDGLRANLATAFEGSTPIVKEVAGVNTFNVVTDYLIDVQFDPEAYANEDEANANKPETLVMHALHEGVVSTIGSEVPFDQFSNAGGVGTHVSSFSKVGPTIADDITRSAIYAAIFALLLIFLYIFIRFSKWQYSLGAVAALFHDTLIVLGIFSLGHGVFGFSMEIDQPFIAAILTVIGYSINDTVVVFDRIREYFNTYTSGDKTSVINAAVNSTVSRTIITSLTTLFGVLVLFLFGGASIKGFAFAILVGVLVGTYSSIFVATPLVHDLSDDLQMKKADDGRRSFSRAGQNS
ncbi:MAG: protein translocase subunit SecDF [Lewinella sp.]|uniref:protein translocase subunit SecDF n=1 Tax=Lewinella sp. TaxID=2004506 RepID=UPI003D6A63AC